MNVDPMTWLLVAVGGGLGGMARLAVGRVVAAGLGARLPWGTLAVNLSGAALMGFLAGAWGLPEEPGEPVWALLAVGLLGGYTTVSSFSLQVLTLWQQGRGGAVLLYALATLGAGLAAVALGTAMAGGPG